MQAAQEEIRAAGLELVDPQERWGARSWEHRLYGEGEIERARAAGTLVAAAERSGPAYYSTTVAPKPKRETDNRARAAAQARALREVACGELVRKLPSSAVATQDLVAAMVAHGGGGFAATMKLTRKWLRDTLGPAEEADPYAWHRAVKAGGERERLHLAWAMAIAQDELRAREPYRRWGAGDVAHVRRLQERVGYVPTEWESAQMTQADGDQDEAEEQL